MDEEISNGNKSQNKRKTKVKVYYSFLTIILLFCIVYFSYSALLNVSKCINMPSKMQKMKMLNTAALEQNKKLKEEIKDFGSLESIEAIARNNLKMAGENEILVIVNKTEPATNDNTKPESNKRFLIKKE